MIKSSQLNPFFFLVFFFIIVLLAAFVPQIQASESLGISVILTIIIMAYTFCWPYFIFKKLATISQKRISYNTGIISLYTVLAIMVVPILVLLNTLEVFHSSTFLSAIFGLIKLVGIFFYNFIYIQICWRTSKLLEKIENEKGIANSKIAQTFLLFFIWPIGIFFLHKRLANILAIEP